MKLKEELEIWKRDYRKLASKVIGKNKSYIKITDVEKILKATKEEQYHFLQKLKELKER